MDAVSSSYHIPLVILSIVIAILASYAALDLAIQVNKAKSIARHIWVGAGAFAMGLGIWAMHFIAMLAFHLSIPVTYNVTLVIFSILPAIIASALALFIISRTTMGRRQVLLGAFFMAAGIVSMHYSGMEAMKMDAVIEYNRFIWGLSAIIAFVVSIVALYLLSFVSQNYRSRKLPWIKTVSALIMGIAISGMHYTGMAAASYKPHQHADLNGAAPFNSTLLAYAIGIVILILLGLVFLSTFIDRRFEYQSIQSERKFRSLIESANDAIILSDSRGTIISWNKGAECIFGFHKNEVLGKNLQIIIPEKYQEAHQKGMARYLATGEPKVMGKTVELEGVRKDGSEFPIELSLASWKEDGNVFFSSIIRDISLRKKNEEKINQMIYRDPLTGLPNRLLLNDRLGQALDQANNNKQTLGIMFIDLDRFKYINDTLGHAVGDELLIEVAKRIEACVGKADTVSRQGGDEFIVLVPNTTSDEVTKKAQKVIDSFSHSVMLNEQELFVTPSIGISMYPGDGRDIEALIKNADTAMYRVKEQGKNNFQFYTPEMNEAVTKKMQLEVGLRKALERNEFHIVYQPQIDVKTGQVIGAEALLRWEHPEWGSISPAEFIPIAEETGLILQIGEWVLRGACLQNKQWQKYGFRELRVAVNISSRQFQQSDLVERVSEILKETGLAPEYLELELTESIIQDSKYAVAKMQQLKEMGIHLSIDDFGTGYSSLSYLKTFPIHTLKIDRSFTSNIYTDSKDASLVETIISMAHNLNLKVIAEGVETEEQLQFLQQKQCNEAQGYFFSRPISASAMEEVLQGESTAEVH
ncbi:bifunctional diguanylate cyclase/phosphodiesterase [Fictibacillus sp. BK138]|uniref:bifunctional diguanylate cyclase/phosphodiesterase n=1 Tax=Fictibacillus sp. BK138 TaxID=2512121 RepID=UPI00102A1561|nr:bifunctional diguanylate cyclase/phosphodiesterase [Fictibacillus sp. BK138]RZT21419.1 PAS domain S-box-containing protein/diguanylate cyclase (GGDEF)-like protein [Fictibacillus sp. BK138]